MAAPKLCSPAITVTIVLVLTLSTITAIDVESNSEDQFHWQILSAKNFSSQIRLYPHVLLLVTVPWCGESRSLMREISQRLARQQHKYNYLKLMLVHRNRNKLLADSLDAAEGVTVLCYRHAVSYKYEGNLNVQDILSSMHYLTSLASEDLPLKKLNNAKEVEMFLASTDKAVLLLESCGWTAKLLEQQNGNVTVQGEVIPGGLNKEFNRTLASGRQKNLKDMGNDMTNCDVEDGCGGSPWVGEFNAENGTASSTKEDVQSTFGTSCSFEEYDKFKSFFSKFMAVARALYLPPQRQRYGIVSERSLLSPLGIEESDRWSLIISYAGCPSCLRTLEEENHLQDALEMDDLPVMELENKRSDLGPALPIDKPSILLFVDRTSESAEIRRISKEALHAFQEVAMQYWKQHQVDGRNIGWPKRFSLHKNQMSTSMFDNHRVLVSPSSQLLNLKDKMSIMIVNEGKHVTLDSEALNLQGGSLQEILTYLLGQKQQSKLSSLAKEAGFQLLSNDIDIKIADVQTESKNQGSVKKAVEVSDQSFLDMNKVQADKVSSLEEQSEPVNIEAAYGDIEPNASNDLVSKESASVDPRHSGDTPEVASAVDLDSKVQTYVLVDKSEGLKRHWNGFTGSFLFSDGNYQFLRSLTNGSEVPRIVIIDPISQQHYIYPDMENFTFPSISSFIDEFLNGTLISYQRSGPVRNSVEMPHPPFVNLDFHEKDSIPCVTAETFSEFVIDSGQFNAQYVTNAWRRDAVVLLTSSSCGFCQRMELVVREVYRALKGYMNMNKCESTSKELFPEDGYKDVFTKLPAFYLMDCTLNECSWILKSVGENEVYPTLLLFPAKKKTAIRYEGDMMVTDIIKFIANHGSTSQHLAKQKGTLWTDEEERGKHDNKFMSGGNKETADEKDKRFGPLSESGKLQNGVKFKLNDQVAQSIAVGMFLAATEYVHGLNPFNEAKVLIVGADHGLGFQGLIVNKPMSWDSVSEFQAVELLKEAPLSFGGPVILERMPLVSLTRSSFNDNYPQVLPGVYFVDQLATTNVVEQIKAGNQSATDYWFFWGFSGWSRDQLVSEIAGGVWSLHKANLEGLQWPRKLEPHQHN